MITFLSFEQRKVMRCRAPPASINDFSVFCFWLNLCLLCQSIDFRGLAPGGDQGIDCPTPWTQGTPTVASAIACGDDRSPSLQQIFCGPEKTRPPALALRRPQTVFWSVSQNLHFRSGAAKRGTAKPGQINPMRKHRTKTVHPGPSG